MLKRFLAKYCRRVLLKKILIADDSLVYRHALNSALSECPGFQVVGAVKNGSEVLDFIAKNHVDLLTLDIEMPVMDGFTVLEKLKDFPSRPKVVVFTSIDAGGANNAIKALHLGAEDFVTKIEGSTDINNNIREVKDALLPKIYSLLHLADGGEAVSNFKSAVAPVPIAKRAESNRALKDKYSYILIGSSTGGPEALRTIFDGLRGKKQVPILIVQHMPPLYTAMLAKTLSLNSSYNVIEASDGMYVEQNHCYLAPGDFHMEIIPDGEKLKISLHQKEKECFVRPAVNFLFRSSRDIAAKSLYLVLTGMGSDGADGIAAIYDKGPDLIIQDEATSVVWGMPGEISKRKLETKVMSLSDIKNYINKLIA